MKAEIDGRQDKVHNSMVSVMEAQNEIRSQLGYTSRSPLVFAQYSSTQCRNGKS